MQPTIKLEGGVTQTENQRWRAFVTVTIDKAQPVRYVGEPFLTEEQALRDYQNRVKPTVERIYQELEEDPHGRGS